MNIFQIMEQFIVAGGVSGLFDQVLWDLCVSR